ncbi:MAG TPA: glycosyltransferase family 2 protein [Candidatus Limnocylindria bacterium]
MRSRLLAAGTLLVSAAVAWLSITVPLAARLLQGVVVVSMLYVGYLAYRGWRTMRADLRRTDGEAAPTERWVTLVVPASNEAAVIEDVVRDLVAQDYADERGPCFDVIVVDDGSADGTGDLARAAALPLGDRISVLRREPDAGAATKAAVLEWVAPQVRGEVLGVIDADARADPDFLRRVMHAWRADPSAAAIQAQRRTMNRHHSWLPAAQDEELLMDMTSQCGRWVTDGTAELRGNGMFLRRAVLEAIGGWSESAITEDLEISTRLTAAGHHVALAPAAELREEAIERVGPLWRQRMRWAEGSMRRLMEHGPSLLADVRLPIGRRLDFLLFVTEFVVPPLFVMAIAASLLNLPTAAVGHWTVAVSLFLGYGLGTYLLALGGLAAHGERGLRLVGRAARGSLFLSHWLLVVPVALFRIALLPPSSVFVQTPRHRRRSD